LGAGRRGEETTSMAIADRRHVLAGTMAGLLAPTQLSRAAEEITNAAQEAAVYARALPAYIYGFAFRHAAMLRWTWLNRPITEPRPSLAINQMWRQSHWPATALPFGGRACLETLACAAWLDLGEEPVILSVPDSGRDYFGVRLCSADCDVFANVGSRSGHTARHYAIAGPDWMGPLPQSLTGLLRAPTREAVLIGQVFVAGPRDFARARTLQTRIDVTPLSLWSKLDATYPPDRTTWMPATADDALGEWRTIQRALRENPSGADSRAILTWLETLGLAALPGDDRLAAAARQGLSRAAADGRAAIEEARRAAASGTRIHGWLYPPTSIGRAGRKGDFLTRAAIQCADETLADTSEAVTVLTSATDETGAPLDSRRSYRVTFAPGLFPPAAAWSLTVCDNAGQTDAAGRGHFARVIDAVHIGRHALDLAIGAEHTGAPNSLVAPGGPFELVLRFYDPGPDLVEQRWQPPPVSTVG
jgi:hypothetical protein